jgi:beta-lactamase regulating signal transducer with metallopeptidase domain/DUF4097 and DUF4098 domain-containing protein YvlB
MTLFLVKLTLLLTLGVTLATLLRGRSAATRHFVWTLTLFSTLLLAAGTQIAPALTVEIPDWGGSAAFTGTTPQPVIPTPEPAAPTTPQARVEATAPIRANATVPPARTAPLATIWWIGFAAMVLWNLAGHLGLMRIARGARTVNDDALVAETLRQSGVTRPVRVATSSSVRAPMTWGWSHPLVLLPGDAMTWPTERRRAALLHELAHVERNDSLVQLFAAFICAVYWFHPIVWLALRRLRRESEQASDDRVLSRGMMAPDYATHLVDVAVAARARRFGGLLALGMACPSHLESRLRALLDETRARNVVSRRGVAMAVVLSLLVLLPLAAARPAIRAATRLRAPIRTNVTEPDFGRDVTRISRAVTRPIGRALRVFSRSGPGFDQSVANAKPLPQRTVDASPGETLVLDLETGGYVQVQGWDQPRVTVDAVLGGRDAEDTRVGVDRSGSEVRVTSKFAGTGDSHSASHQFIIHVPHRFNIDIDSAGGSLSLANVEGTFRGTTGGGTFKLRNVKGTAHLSTGGGDIDVDDVDLEGRITTGGGTVTMTNVRGNFQGTSGSEGTFSRESSTRSRSSVTTYMDDHSGARPATSPGALRIDKAGGGVDLEGAPNGATIHTGGGRVIVGPSAGNVDVTTGGGGIAVGPVAGSVRASTGAGDVEVTVTDPAGREQSVEVFTGSGDVTVVLPKTLDARFEIETAYTRESSPASIDSVWELDHKPPTDWDASAGTPRRFVRATGIAGHGRGLVRIKAVNGNVTLRRGR